MRRIAALALIAAMMMPSAAEGLSRHRLIRKNTPAHAKLTHASGPRTKNVPATIEVRGRFVEDDSRRRGVYCYGENWHATVANGIHQDLFLWRLNATHVCLRKVNYGTGYDGFVGKIRYHFSTGGCAHVWCRWEENRDERESVPNSGPGFRYRRFETQFRLCVGPCGWAKANVYLAFTFNPDGGFTPTWGPHDPRVAIHHP